MLKFKRGVATNNFIELMYFVCFRCQKVTDIMEEIQYEVNNTNGSLIASPKVSRKN